MASVISETKSYITQIILNNPDKGNVVNNDNLSLLNKYIKEAGQNSDTRVIVIRGKNKVFCRGMDFNNLIKNENSISENFHKPYLDAVLAIRNSPKPVIAAIDGDLLAGGMGIALACDILLATRSSIFGLSEVIFGLIPAYVFPFLLERISLKKARYLVLSSKKFTAEEAYNFGLIDEVVEDNNLDSSLKEYYKRLLYSSPDALTTLKSYSDSITENNIQNSLNQAQKQLTSLLMNKKNIAAIKAFLNGEKMEWSVKYSTRNKV